MSVKVLLATPKIKDLYFFKTIVLLIKENNKDYQMGLILNKKMEEKIKDIWDVVNPEANVFNNKNLKNGGPIYGSVHVIHKIKKYSDLELFKGTYLSVNPKNIEKVIENKTKQYEMFVGYCQWSSCQLNAEIITGNWWETEVDDFMIFGDNSDYWTLKKEEQNKKVLDILNIKIQNHLMN